MIGREIETTEKAIVATNSKLSYSGCVFVLADESWAKNVGLGVLLWCCYITVDSAMAASRNRFCSCKLSLHEKTFIIRNMTNNIKFLLL